MKLKPLPLFPLGVLLGLVGLTFWLSRYVAGDLGAARKAGAGDPDIVVEQFVARKLSPEGDVQYVVQAKTMAHFPADDSSLLEQVVFTATNPGQPTIVAKAPRGRLIKGGDEVVMDGGVVIVSEQFGKSPAMTMRTPKLTLLPEEHLARSREGVVIESAQGVVRASHFELNNLARTLKLTKVNANLVSARQN